MALDVSQVYLATPGTTLRSASATQTVGAFTQDADAQRVTAGTLDVAQVWLGVPDTALPTRNASASQTVGTFAQSASLSDIVGQISGGGAISEDRPHRSVGVTQSVGTFQQSAAGGGAGVLGPILASQSHGISPFTQTARADAQAAASASQTVGDFVTAALMYDPVAPRTRGGGGSAGGPTISRRGKKFIAQVRGVTVSADSLSELQRKVAQLEAQAPQDAPEAPPAARREPAVTKVADPVSEPPAPVPAEQVDAMVQQFIAQQQALVDTYQREVESLKLASMANTAALRASMQQEIEARVAQASSDMDAVVALLMDEPVPMAAQQVPVPVMLPPPIPKREPRKVDEVVASKSKGLGDALTAALADIVNATSEGSKAHTQESVKPLQDEIKRLNDEVKRLSSPKRVVRENGKVTGVMVGDEFRPVERDEAGRIVGI